VITQVTWVIYTAGRQMRGIAKLRQTSGSSAAARLVPTDDRQL
jgi:hypothetical protein